MTLYHIILYCITLCYMRCSAYSELRAYSRNKTNNSRFSMAAHAAAAAAAHRRPLVRSSGMWCLIMIYVTFSCYNMISYIYIYTYYYNKLKVNSIINKHRILKHRILELPIWGSAYSELRTYSPDKYFFSMVSKYVCILCGAHKTPWGVMISFFGGVSGPIAHYNPTLSSIPFNFQ